MRNNVKVSIITVDFNQPEVTVELLKSLERQEYKDLEVIVVDNGSKVNQEEKINSQFPHVKFIRSEKNLGFAGGNNLGIAHATGGLLFFVNNDTEIPEGTIQNLVNVMESSSMTGIVCPLIYYYDFPELTQFAGYTPINTLTGRNHAVGYKRPTLMSDSVKDSPFAHGAAMMVSREVIEKVGMMPENYFLYYEELDWGAAIRRAGYDIKVACSAFILHKESVSTGKASPLKTYFQTRNRSLFMRRNFSGIRKWAFYFFFAFIALPKNILFYLIKRQKEHLQSFVNGVWWNLTHRKNSTQIGYKYDILRS